MHPRRAPPRALALLLTLALLAGLFALAPSAMAQGPLGPCTLLACEFEIAIVNWTGSGAPGTFISGTIRVTNTGQSEDTYSIAITVDNETWLAGAEKDETASLPAGSSPLPGGGSEENTEDFEVLVFVPEEALVGASVNVRVTVTSQNDDELDPQDLVLITDTTQSHAWSLSCTDAITIEKARSGSIELIATNRGNGPDRASVVTTPLAGLQIDELAAFDLGARATSMRDIDLGVGLALEDGDYALRWDLQSTNDAAATASCTTTLTVTGGENETDDDDTEEGPGPVLALVLLVALLAAALRRRTERSP